MHSTEQMDEEQALVDITEQVNRNRAENDKVYKAFKNSICTFYIKAGNQFGYERTKQELYEEAARINLKYNF